MNARGVTFVVLAAAFTFGIGTLWIRAAWPFAVFQALILTAAGVWFAAAAWRGSSGLSPWLLLPCGVVLIGGVQLALGGTEGAWQTRQSVLEWITHGCAAVLAFQVCRDERLRVLSLRVFALVAGALALLSTVQNYAAPGRVLWLWASGYPDGVFGPFVYHTKLANFAELAIPVAVWLAVTERRARGLYVTAAVALAGSVVASASRGGVVVLLVEFALLGVIAVRGRSWKTAAAFAGALALAVGAFGWELAAARFKAHDPLEDLRLPMAATAVDMAGRYWMTGAGLGTWTTVYPEFARFDLHLRLNQVHSDWLQWLVEGGVGWPLLMGAMALIAVRAARREWWTLGLVFVWLHGVGDYPMQQTPALASLVVAFWGGCVATPRRAVRPVSDFGNGFGR